VQREPPLAGGRGGSALMHRAFREGRSVFVSRPRNHFPLREDAAHTLLLAGGIGVTPLIAMAHRLHALGRPFELHYSVPSRARAGFAADLAAARWADRVHWHVKDEGGRADLAVLIPPHRLGWQLCCCGSARYMDAVFAAAAAAGWPDDALQREFFSVPEQPGRVDRPFVVQLADGRRLPVPVGRSATEVLAAAGVAVDVKCSDGLCGVCATAYDAAASGVVEHRDVVLGAAERAHKVLLCCVRMQQDGALLVLRR
jgi:ferredoxin-NADP reductase